MTKDEFFKKRMMMDFEKKHGITKIPPVNHDSSGDLTVIINENQVGRMTNRTRRIRNADFRLGDPKRSMKYERNK